MPTLEQVLPRLSKAKVFTTLDAKDGFNKIGLDEASSKKTTFRTPFGRYRYLRMPLVSALLQKNSKADFMNSYQA